MKIKNHNEKRVVLLALFFIATIVDAGKDLIIDPIPQLGTNTCWAACACMVIRAYDRGDATTERDLRQWVFGSAKDSGNTLSGHSKATDKAIEHFSRDNIQSVWHRTGNASECYNLGCISATNLVNEINGGRPFVAGLRHLERGFYHAVVVRGYTGSGGSDVGNVIYNNPALLVGGRRELPFNEFILGNEYYWTETLVLTTNPRTPIPVSIGPKEWVKISNSTTEITTSPQAVDI